MSIIFRQKSINFDQKYKILLFLGSKYKIFPGPFSDFSMSHFVDFWLSKAFFDPTIPLRSGYQALTAAPPRHPAVVTTLHGRIRTLSGYSLLTPSLRSPAHRR